MRIKTLVLISICLFTDCGGKQSKKEFDWKAVESPVSNEDKRRLLAHIDDDVTKGFEEMANTMKSNEIYNSFHVLDLNDDKQDDMIYNGFGGASDEFAMVFLNINGLLKKSLHTYGHITYVKKNGSVTELTILKSPMVGDNSSDSISYYQVKGVKIINVKNENSKPQN